MGANLRDRVQATAGHTPEGPAEPQPATETTVAVREPGSDVARRPAGALAVDPGQAFWTDPQRAALRQIGIDDASNGDLAVFLNYAQRTGLDPFSRQLYMIGRNHKNERTNQWEKKWTIQASIDGLRIVAQRSGEYAGQVGPEWCGQDGVWRDVWLSTEPPAAARVGVLRRGWSQPMYAVAIFHEYAQTTRDGKLTAMWASKGALMIAKCAEALALRKAFPHDLSGIYTSEEMSQADISAAAAAPPPAIQQASVQPEKDWCDDIAAATTVDELRDVWRAAAAAGAVDDRFKECASARAAELQPEPGDGPVQAQDGDQEADVVVEDPPEGGWPETPEPGSEQAQATAAKRTRSKR